MSDLLILGDCIQVLKDYQDSFDMVFTDPPYNLQHGNNLQRPEGGEFIGVEEEWDKFSDFASYDQFTINWLNSVRLSMKQDATIWVMGTYHNIYRVGYHMMNLGFGILNEVVWIKNNPPPNFMGVRFQGAHETLIWASKTKDSKYTFNYQDMKAVNGVQMRDDWYFNICQGQERLTTNGVKVHPTQKPESLLNRVVLSCTQDGDRILDPFMGTGTTGAVARKLGRSFVGIEKEEVYFKAAQNRLQLPIHGKAF